MSEVQEIARRKKRTTKLDKEMDIKTLRNIITEGLPDPRGGQDPERLGHTRS